MESKAKVVVIGGGVAGASTLYHLAKKGWTDVVLIERKELTSGSTWHAAGLLPLFNMSYSVSKLHQYSVNLYQSLEQETGQDVGFRKVSNIRLANCEYRMDEYRYYAGVAKTVGVNVKFLSPEQVKEIWPLCNTNGIIGAIQHPDDGYIQPADVTRPWPREPAHVVPKSTAIPQSPILNSKPTSNGGLLRTKVTFFVNMWSPVRATLPVKWAKW